MGAETISNKRHTDTGTKNGTTKKKKKESDQVLEAEKISNERHTDTGITKNKCWKQEKISNKRHTDTESLKTNDED